MYVEYPLLHWTIKLLLLKQNQFILFFILFHFIPRLIGKQKLKRILMKILVLFSLLSLVSIFNNLYQKKSSKHEFCNLKVLDQTFHEDNSSDDSKLQKGKISGRISNEGEVVVGKVRKSSQEKFIFSKCVGKILQICIEKLQIKVENQGLMKNVSSINFFRLNILFRADLEFCQLGSLFIAIYHSEPSRKNYYINSLLR